MTFVIVGFSVLVILMMVYSYQHRNDPLTWEEAFARLKAADCCVCEMCVGAHMRHGKR